MDDTSPPPSDVAERNPPPFDVAERNHPPLYGELYPSPNRRSPPAHREFILTHALNVWSHGASPDGTQSVANEPADQPGETQASASGDSNGYVLKERATTCFHRDPG